VRCLADAQVPRGCSSSVGQLASASRGDSSGHPLQSSHAPAQLHNSSHKHEDEEEEQEQERPAAQKWAKVFARPAHDRLEDTEGGACSRLYHYLWCKDDNGHSPREFRLPDTVRG